MEQEERDYLLCANEDYGEPTVDDDDDDDDDQCLIEGDAVDEREAIEIALSQNMAPAPNVAAHSLAEEENEGEISGSSIIYAPSRKLVEQIAERLASRGYKAMPYHAGLPAKHLKAVHERFLSGTCKVCVCLSDCLTVCLSVCLCLCLVWGLGSRSFLMVIARVHSKVCNSEPNSRSLWRRLLLAWVSTGPTSDT
jgi:hypothetical protein